MATIVEPSAAGNRTVDGPWVDVARELGPGFASRAAAHDADDSFVAENYVELKERKVFGAAIPTELGGGGASHPETCEMIRVLARHCGSTALALSMHTHLVAATIWNWQHGRPVEPLLRRVAAEQIVLVSTGASDWLESSGRAEKVDGGYKITARKIFGSGSPAGTLLMTSAIYDDPQQGPTVLHLPVTLAADGVAVQDNWRTLGMRGSGSNDIVLDGVFVPESAVAMTREPGKWHPFFVVVAHVALPIIMSAYLGVAEAAAELARGIAGKRQNDPNTFYLVGELENALAIAQLAVRDMIAICDDYRFEPSNESASDIVVRKTIAANAVLQTAEKALEVAGGGAFFRAMGLERLVRDAHGAQFHPLQEKRQHLFTGRVALGLDPIG
jgi:alkylation response protein AidB-like acyl-CoA dehydrogenase